LGIADIATYFSKCEKKIPKITAFQIDVLQILAARIICWCAGLSI